MDTPRRIALGCMVAGVLCATSGVAYADQEVVVPYGDLDLNTRYGVTTMYTRLEDAARTACTTREGSSSRHMISVCIDANIRQAVAQIGAPRLVILYETRTGHAVLHARRQDLQPYLRLDASR